MTDVLPHREREVLDPVPNLGTSLGSELGDVPLGPGEPEHALQLGHREQQRTVGVAGAQHGVDLEHRSARVGGVEARAVVHDAFEHGGHEDAHGVIMTGMHAEHELPEGLRRSASAPGNDPRAAAARGAEMLAAVGPPLVAGIAAHLPEWLGVRTLEVLAAWRGRPPAPDEAASVEAAVARAGERVGEEVEALLAEDPAAQRSTPLAIVRSAHREPGEVLAALRVPHVVRDPFEVRALPEDHWGLAPPDLAALDPELGPLLLAWGLAKATVLRARSAGA